MVAHDFRQVVFPVEDAIEIIEVQRRDRESGETAHGHLRHIRRRVVDGGLRKAQASAGEILDEDRVRYSVLLLDNHVARIRELRHIDQRGTEDMVPLDG